MNKNKKTLITVMIFAVISMIGIINVIESGTNKITEVKELVQELNSLGK